ncbi:hypothetical protein CKO36_07705 [Rhabdochromatium marinum]|nr:hypothetical protein [Rhabdochromatium marinum]MBK1648480.1 hypothetical protein [Rhabdochromatium marinum]
MRFPDGHTELLWAEDISHYGLSIHADKPQRVGVKLRVLVFMFNSQLGKEVHAELVVQVVSCVLDSTTADFRLGLKVEEFIGDAEEHLLAQINALSKPMQTGTTSKGQYNKHDPLLSMSVPTSFPLHRRVKLALANGSNLIGWTEDVTPNYMRIALSTKLDDKSVHGINIPVILSNEPEIISVHAKARVESVVFRPMGAFATNFSIFDYKQDGLNQLRAELRERFPMIAQDTTSDALEDAAEDDTEALPFLGDMGIYN